LAMACLLIVAACCGGSTDPAPPPELARAVTSHDTVDVRWEEDWEAAFGRARVEDKPVLVNFQADWCVWCKHLESITFRDAKVAGLLAGRVVPLNVDIDRAEQELLERLDVEAPPTVVLLTFEGRELGRIPGYLPPAGFLDALERFLPKQQAEPA